MVPEGAVPGTKLQCSAPDGQELRLTVPDGVPPGSVMTLTQDPITKGWKCMAEPADNPPSPTNFQQEAQYQTASAPTISGQVRSAQPAASAPSVSTVSYTAPASGFSGVSYSGATYTTSEQAYAAGTAYRQPQLQQVNLSYVPPAAMPMNSSVQALPLQPAPGQEGSVNFTYEVRPNNSSYNPPPAVLIEQKRPSYTPPPQPQVMAGAAIPAPYPSVDQMPTTKA